MESSNRLPILFLIFMRLENHISFCVNTSPTSAILVDPVGNLFLKALLEHFHGLRDLHQGYHSYRPIHYYPWLMLISTVAKTANLTLLTCKKFDSYCPHSNISNTPRIRRSFSTNEVLSDKNIVSTWKTYGNFSYKNKIEINRFLPPVQTHMELPKFTWVREDYLNFIYCDVPRRAKTYPWKFSLFTDPFDS